MDPRQLRDETRAEHEATEALMPLASPGLTRDLYVTTLQTLLPVVESWETWAADNVPEGMRELLRTRRRSHLLRADLATLFAAPVDPASGTPDWAEVVQGGEDVRTGPGFHAAFLGALYVMEGSTLGGRFLARHVEQVLGLAPGQGDAYFQGHGEATGGLWREVTAHIAAVPEDLSPALTAAARRAFAAFGDALREGKLAESAVAR